MPVADRGQSYERAGAKDFEDENFGAGGDYRGERDFGGFSDQDYGSQGYSGQGYGDRSYGDPDYGGQTFARRGGGEQGDDGAQAAEPQAPELAEGTCGFAHHSAAYADHGRGYGDQGFAGLTYGDHGSAPADAGRGQGFGGQNYDGKGRIRVPSDDMTTAAQPRPDAQDEEFAHASEADGDDRGSSGRPGEAGEAGTGDGDEEES
ncbi:hypothetical protein P873_07995 [Arenimonas composti TR7-09 = DSM 18010]|uniref:Uncharacterized protein n=1 Tax=Arenimonas composti TR7-09 = DSM 18010 TaxID=1121013 RepID=A0A091C0L2_9GAMM|nr:hypothetical protein P873_07995 [Arenimonas composti TR7-09 = DSM 18010]